MFISPIIGTTCGRNPTLVLSLFTVLPTPEQRQDRQSSAMRMVFLLHLPLLCLPITVGATFKFSSRIQTMIHPEEGEFLFGRIMLITVRGKYLQEAI